MSKVLAILMEPAQYTLDRNKAVYDPLGITYTYLSSTSTAGKVSVHSDFEGKRLFKKVSLLNHILHDHDAVIMNGYSGIEFVLLWLLNLRYRRIIGIDSDTPLNIPPNTIKRAIKYLYLRLFFRPSWCCGLAGGAYSHKELFTHYGMPENRVFLMPMVIDTDRFSKVCREKPVKPFRFLYVGRLVACKGIDILLKAFRKIVERYPDTELMLAGDGEQAERLKSEATNIPNIIWAGKRYGQKLLDCYAKSHCLVLPSLFEPWGLVVNEAMSAGLPVIVSDAVGARQDLVENKNTGFIFRSGDADSLFQSMERLQCDKELYHQYSANAAKLLNEYWNYSLYRECLENFLNYGIKK